MQTQTEPFGVEATISASSPDPGDSLSDLQLTRLHQYVLLHKLGVGGMGVVYAAFDETLDRKVALKLLRSRTHGQPRLLREAQAMARVSHSNVVQVYEIGEFEGSAFIAMEFVDGETLGAWLRSEPRSRAQILDVFIAAGRGLIAAHDKGLIHRDFKPDNVMVGRDGRVLVMDFGLARGQTSAASDLTGSLPRDLRVSIDIDVDTSALCDDLTATGSVMGTPAYMAPEQYRGGETDARSDQFSFCVALWEALFNERPFAGNSLLALEEAVINGELSAPAPRDVPGWLRRVLERGLAAEPSERWPSVAALLEALADDPTHRRRWIGTAIVALSLAVGGALYVASTVDERESAAISACHAEGGALKARWSERARDEMGAAFVAAGEERGADAWTRTERVLDEYADRWSEMRTETCLETRVEGSREPRSYVEISACLDERKAIFEGLLDAWGEVDERVITRAPRATAELPLVSMCARDAWLAHRSPPPSDELSQARVRELRAKLEMVSALHLAAEDERALALAELTLAQAIELGWGPLVAEARFAVGDLLEYRGQYRAAREVLTQAFFDAGREGHDLVALKAASKLTWTAGQRLYDHEGGLLWGELGSMFVERMQLTDTIHHAKLQTAMAAIYFKRGDLDQAITMYGDALKTREAELGRQHPLVASSLNNIGLAQLESADLDGALESMRESKAIREAALGADHPVLAGSFNNIGLIQMRRGDYPEALDAGRRALEILERTRGSEHPMIASALNNIGYTQFVSGDLHSAFETHERALALREKVLGPAHPECATSLTHLGEIELKRGNLERAQALLEQALAIPEQASRSPAQRGQNDFALARTLWELDESEEARRRAGELAAHAREHYEKAGKLEAQKLQRIDAWSREHPPVKPVSPPAPG